jgi:hypothetical protein
MRCPIQRANRGWTRFAALSGERGLCISCPLYSDQTLFAAGVHAVYVLPDVDALVGACHLGHA